MRVFVLLLAACADVPTGDDPFARLAAEAGLVQRYSTVCADGATTPGIDVSSWQQGVDWNAVAASGVQFAVIRVSHGLGTYDSRFTENWSGAKAAGVRRGVYQYFSGSDDPTAQAELLLDEMGPLEDGDLPPVLDVESGDNEGISVSQMTANVATWMDVVRGALGREPMIYTGAYAWTSLTGDADFTASPVWTANWDVDCPLVPDPWTDWTLWQHSSTGSVGGISTAVDLDVYNGDAAALYDFAWHPEPECSGTCTVAKDGETVIEEDASCACTAGTLASADGHAGHAYTTPADMPSPGVDDAVSWPLTFAKAGTYDLSIWVPAAPGLTAGAVVEVTHDGVTDTVTVDENAGAGDWAYIGAFHFATRGTQSVRVGDGYEDAGNAGHTVALDALRFTLADGGECACSAGDTDAQACSDGTERTRTCDDGCAWSAWSACTGHASVVEAPEGCACAAGEGAPAAAAAALAGVVAAWAGRRKR